MTSPDYTPIYHLERVSEVDTIQVLIVMTQRGKIRFKRHKDCETGCRNIHSDPENLIESQTHESVI